MTCVLKLQRHEKVHKPCTQHNRVVLPGKVSRLQNHRAKNQEWLSVFFPPLPPWKWLPIRPFSQPQDSPSSCRIGPTSLDWLHISPSAIFHVCAQVWEAFCPSFASAGGREKNGKILGQREWKYGKKIDINEPDGQKWKYQFMTRNLLFELLKTYWKINLLGEICQDCSSWLD